MKKHNTTSKSYFPGSKFDEISPIKKIDRHKTETTRQYRDHTQEFRKLKFCKSGNG